MEKEQEKALKAREAALKGALMQIDKQFGAGSIMKMGDDSMQVQVAAIPTGALSLDLALGVGGVPRGRIVEVFGPESSGKTTLIYHVLANAQKHGGICAFIDAEHAMDPVYAKRIGVDVDELLVSQPDHGEQALEIADLLIRSGAVDVVAIDSVAALTPKVELEGAMGDQTVGLQARMMSQAMRKLAGNLNRANTLCIFTNQIREKIGVMFGSPETQPGGRALKFYSSQRLDIRRIETLKEGTEAVGNRVRVKVVKNKVAAPFRQAEFDIEYGQGISSEGCILDLGIEHNIVQKSGSFFSYGDDRLGQGRNNAKGYLRENPQVAKEIEHKIYEALGVDPPGSLTVVEPPPDAEAEPGVEAEPAERCGRRGHDPRGASRLAHPGLEEASVARTESERAIDLAYKAVARRELTVAELRTRLERKRVPPEAIDDAVAELEATGFLDDARYARQFTEDKRELDQWGSERIARDLHRRGIAAHLIEEVVSTRSRDSELQTAVLLLEQRHPTAPEDDRERDRAWQMLVRRGYTPEIAYDAIRAFERAARERRRAA